jgi:hypothetical protein
MERRQFLTSASATVAAASLAGCSGIFGGDGGGGSSGPEGTVEAYVDAFNDNDAQALRDLTHPEGSEAPGEDLSDSDLEAISMSIESMETLEQSDGQATVEAEIEITFTIQDQEESSVSTIEFDIREYEGDWLIYGTTEVSSGEN